MFEIMSMWVSYEGYAMITMPEPPPPEDVLPFPPNPDGPLAPAPPPLVAVPPVPRLIPPPPPARYHIDWNAKF